GRLPAGWDLPREGGGGRGDRRGAGLEDVRRRDVRGDPQGQLLPGSWLLPVALHHHAPGPHDREQSRQPPALLTRAATLRPMAYEPGEIGERGAEFTFRFPVHPLVKGDRQALEDAVRHSDYRFVKVEDMVVSNLGAGGGAGPYVIIDFVVPIFQHAGGDILAIAALAGLKKALGALRGAHPQRILQVRVGGG